MEFWLAIREQIRSSKNRMMPCPEAVASACGIMFNIMGWLDEYLKLFPEVDFDGKEPTPEMAKRILNIEHETGVTHTIIDCRDDQCDGTCCKVDPSDEVLPDPVTKRGTHKVDKGCQLDCRSTNLESDKYPCNWCVRNPFREIGLSPENHDYYQMSLVVEDMDTPEDTPCTPCQQNCVHVRVEATCWPCNFCNRNPNRPAGQVPPLYDNYRMDTHTR
jgi:hypothetical protein